MRWHTLEEQYLQKLHDLCIELSKDYMDLYTATHRIQTRLRLPAIVLSSCSGVASFGSSSFPQDKIKMISMGIGVVNVFIAILQTYESYLKIGDIVAKSLSASQALKKLADDIYCEIFIPVEDRNANGITFLRDSFSRYQAIFDQAPPLKTQEDFTPSYNKGKQMKDQINNEIKKIDARISNVVEQSPSPPSDTHNGTDQGNAIYLSIEENDAPKRL